MENQDNTINNTNNREELPQWARDEITKANDEAAKARVAKKTAVEEAKAALTAEYESKMEELQKKLDSITEEKTQTRHEVETLRVAIQAGIDSDRVETFAGLLKGENEDELRSHAEELKKLFGPTQEVGKNQPATDPSQGQVNHTPLNGDPLLEKIMRAVGSR